MGRILQEIKLDTWTNKIFQCLKWVVNPAMKLSWLNSSRPCGPAPEKLLLLRCALEKSSQFILRETIRNGHIYKTYSISVITHIASIRASRYEQPNFENQCTDPPFKNVIIYIQNPWWWKQTGIRVWRRGTFQQLVITVIHEF